MAPRLMTQARKTPKYRNGRSKWKKKGAPLFNNRGVPFCEYKSRITDYCLVRIMSSNARL